MKNRIALYIEMNSPLESGLESIVINRAYTSMEQRDEAVLEIMEAFNQSRCATHSKTRFCKISFGHNNELGDFIFDTPGEPVAHFSGGQWIVAKLGLPRTLGTRFEISQIPPFGTTHVVHQNDKNLAQFFPSLYEALSCLIKHNDPTSQNKPSIVDRFTGARFWVESNNNQFQLVADSAFAKEVLKDTLNSQRADYLIGQAANWISQNQDFNQSDDSHSLIVDLLEYLGDGSHSPYQAPSIPREG